MRAIGVLVTGVGAPGGVTIMKALRHSELPIRLVAADMTSNAVGLHFADAAYLLPPVSDPTYVERLARLCTDESVDIAFIGAEREIRHLSPHVESLEGSTGCVFMISRPELIAACLDKLATARLLNSLGFDSPVSIDGTDAAAVEAMVRRFGFPLFIKPRFGSGSKMAMRIDDEEALHHTLGHVPEPVVQELLPDDEGEYSVGVYVAKGGKVVGSIVCRRELAAGLTYRAYFDAYPQIASRCEEIAAALEPKGPCNLQLRKHGDRLTVFEVNPRCSSTTAMRSVLGFSEPEMAIREHVLGEELERPSIERGTVLRFWEEAYVSGPPASGGTPPWGQVHLPPASTHPEMMRSGGVTSEADR